MDRWTTEETEDGFRLNYSEDFSVYAYADAAALEEIKDAHNADCDRLAAERDEWKRRCEAVVEWVQQTADLGSADEHTLAIAEGRDNG